MINILVWMFFGGLAGWIISLLVTTKSADATRYVLMGVASSLGGGLLTQYVQGLPLASFSGTTILMSVISALLILGLVRRLA